MVARCKTHREAVAAASGTSHSRSASFERIRVAEGDALFTDHRVTHVLSCGTHRATSSPPRRTDRCHGLQPVENGPHLPSLPLAVPPPRAYDNGRQRTTPHAPRILKTPLIAIGDAPFTDSRETRILSCGTHRATSSPPRRTDRCHGLQPVENGPHLPSLPLAGPPPGWTTTDDTPDPRHSPLFPHLPCAICHLFSPLPFRYPPPMLITRE